MEAAEAQNWAEEPQEKKKFWDSIVTRSSSHACSFGLYEKRKGT
jgi:hypothetical protein